MAKRDARRWVKQHQADPYVRLARAEGLRSRAAFKLLQINARERLLRPGQRVVDLGAAPGGWSQVTARLVGPRGCVVAVDRLPMRPLRGVAFIQGDLGEAQVVDRVWKTLGQRPADALLSDLAPNLSGIRTVDQARVLALADLVCACTSVLLRPGGILIMKLFRGEALEGPLARLVGSFRNVRIRKPQASRERSDEVYAVAEGFQGLPELCPESARRPDIVAREAV